MEELQVTADTTALTSRVAALLDAGHPQAARQILAAVRRLAPSSPYIAQLAARVALGEGCPEQALAELDAAVAQSPEHATLRRCRADVRLRIGDRDGALADAAEAVILDRRDPAGKALLGILLLEVGRPQDALACLNEAVAAQPAHPAYRQGLAAAQEATGDADAALATLTTGIAVMPRDVALRNAAVLLCVRRRDFATGYRLADEARAAGVADACCFGLMGHALSSLGRHTEAADAYAEALKLAPDDKYVRHLVAASGDMQEADRASVAFLRAVFDGHAEDFEQHLLSLGYRIPGLVRAVLSHHPAVAAGKHVGPVLDLGCGTGLVGVAISDLPVGPLVGVDASPAMLAQAEPKQLYAELHEDDLISFLQTDQRRWPLVLAADVLIYFGELREILAAVHARLEPGGWFVCSLEELLPDHDGVFAGNRDWASQRQGRYAHTPAYLTAAAQGAGFALRSLEHETVRLEANAPVAGMLVILERTANDA